MSPRCLTDLRAVTERYDPQLRCHGSVGTNASHPLRGHTSFRTSLPCGRLRAMQCQWAIRGKNFGHASRAGQSEALSPVASFVVIRFLSHKPVT